MRRFTTHSSRWQPLEVKNSIILWPLRVAVSGKASTPGGATELCALLGKEESIARVKTGIELLQNEENQPLPLICKRQGPALPCGIKQFYGNNGEFVSFTNEEGCSTPLSGHYFCSCI